MIQTSQANVVDAGELPDVSGADQLEQEEDAEVAEIIENYIGDLDTRLVLDIFDERIKERRLNTAKDIGRLLRSEEAAADRLKDLPQDKQHALEKAIEQSKALRESVMQFDSYLNKMEYKERERLIKAIQQIHVKSGRRSSVTAMNLSPDRLSLDNPAHTPHPSHISKDNASGLVLDVLDGIPSPSPIQQKRRLYHTRVAHARPLATGSAGGPQGSDIKGRRRHTMAGATDSTNTSAIAAAVAAASAQQRERQLQQQWYAKQQMVIPGSYGLASEDNSEQPKRGKLGKPRRMTQKLGSMTEDPRTEVPSQPAAPALTPEEEFKQKTLAQLLGPRPLRRCSIAVDFIMPARYQSFKATDETKADSKQYVQQSPSKVESPLQRTVSRSSSRSATPTPGHSGSHQIGCSMTTDVIPTSRRGSIVNMSPGAAILMTPTPQLIAGEPMMHVDPADASRGTTPSHGVRRSSVISSISMLSDAPSGQGRRGSLIGRPPPSPGPPRHLSMSLLHHHDSFEPSHLTSQSTHSMTLITPLAEPISMSPITSHGQSLVSRQDESRRGSFMTDDVSGFLNSGSIDGREFVPGRMARRNSLGLSYAMSEDSTHSTASATGLGFDVPPPTHRLQDMLNPISLRRLSHSTEFFDPMKALGEDGEVEAATPAAHLPTYFEAPEEKENHA